MPFGNPILDEIDDAHQRLSPPAQQALEQAHGMIQLPGDPTGASAPSAPSPMANPAATPAVPTLPPSAQPAAPTEAMTHQANLNRLEGSKSGIGQIKSPYARIPLQIADAIGSTFLPRLTTMLPGTQLHHQALVHGAQNAVTSDQQTAAGDAENRLKGAQTAETQAKIPLTEAETQQKLHPAGKFTEGQQVGIDPQHPELGSQIMRFNEQTGQLEFTGIKAGSKPAEPKEGELPLGQERTDALNALLTKRNPSYKLPPNATEKDFDRVQKLMELDLRDAESKAVHDQSAADREASRQQAVELKKMMISAMQASAQATRDAAQANRQGTRDFQQGERGRGLLDKAEGVYRTAAQGADALSDFADMAKSGNKVAAQALPLEGALLINTSQGVKRINRQEIDSISGAGDLFDKISGFFGKWTQGQPIPENIQNNFRQLSSVLKNGAYKTYKGAFDSAKKRYSLGDEEQPMAEPAGGASVDPMVKAYADKHFGGDVARAQAAITEQQGKK